VSPEALAREEKIVLAALSTPAKKKGKEKDKYLCISMLKRAPESR